MRWWRRKKQEEQKVSDFVYEAKSDSPEEKPSGYAFTEKQAEEIADDLSWFWQVPYSVWLGGEKVYSTDKRIGESSKEES